MKFHKPFFLFVIATIIIFFISTHFRCFSYPSLNRSVHSKYLFKDSLFEPGERFTYKVDYNGIYMGRIEWVYLGKQNIDNKLAYTINLSSDVRILKLFSIQSKEKIYIDSDTHLPLKVERKVRYFGRYKEILEEYNQKDSFVKITIKDAKGKREKRLEVKAPIHPLPGYRSGIHNVIALLYFPPKDIKLNLGESFSFNLPAHKVDIKVVALEVLDISKTRYKTLRLEGQPLNFKLWLEKDKRTPLRMDFPVFLGKVTISSL